MIDSSNALLRKKSVMPNTLPSPHAVSQIIVDMGTKEVDDPQHEDLHKFVNALSPETLALLDTELHSPHAERVQRLVTTLVYEDRTSHQTRVAKLREYLILIDDEDREDLDMNLALIEGLHCMTTLAQYKDMTTGGEEHIKLCKALIRVARAAVEVKEERGLRVHDQIGVVFLTDPPLIHLVMDRTDRSRQIARFINERQDLHADNISKYLAVTPPLSNGSL
jgi:hypothetical protein